MASDASSASALSACESHHEVLAALRTRGSGLLPDALLAALAWVESRRIDVRALTELMGADAAVIDEALAAMVPSDAGALKRSYMMRVRLRMWSRAPA
jgi:hypothetical protein